MARVVYPSKKEAEQWSQKEGEGIDAYIARTNEIMKELQAVSAKVDVKRTLVGALVRFGVADWYAVYQVVKDKPFTLRHIPYGDAWRIPDAHMRGLRFTDVHRQVFGDRRIAELLGKK